jgi:hypothetical protein
MEFAVGGGTAQVGVATASHCSWSAQSAASWLSITSGATGTGPGTVTVAASANPSTSEREAALVMAGHSVTARQSALAACTYEISPTSAWSRQGRGSDSIAVSAGANCTWTAASQAEWLSVTSGTTGTGNGTVNYQVTPNGTPFERRASIEVAGQLFTVTQDWDAEAAPTRSRR